MRIAIIGVGRLGSVFASVLSRSHEVLLIDADFKRAAEVAASLGARAAKDIKNALDFEIVIIAVKPQNVEQVVREIGSAQLLVSCAAGVPISKLESWGAQRVIRIMPNICAEVQSAVIAYCLHPEAEKKEKVFLTAFASLGLCVKTDETHLDPITAISGSGPAFVALLANAMIEQAVSEGLDEELAERAVAQTLVGTGKLMLAGWTTKKIIETVASPGGTTEAGLKMLDKAGATKAVKDAVAFATAKAKEIGKK